MNPSLRDKMLRLMGGCVHKWVRPSDDWSMAAWVCGKCYRSHGDKRHDGGGDRPAVGDGHEPTTEELAALCGRLWPYCVIEIHNIDLNTASVGLRIPHKLTDAHYWATAQDTLNHTLASAIDAATEDVSE